MQGTLLLRTSLSIKARGAELFLAKNSRPAYFLAQLQELTSTKEGLAAPKVTPHASLESWAVLPFSKGAQEEKKSQKMMSDANSASFGINHP